MWPVRGVRTLDMLLVLIKIRYDTIGEFNLVICLLLAFLLSYLLTVITPSQAPVNVIIIIIL